METAKHQYYSSGSPYESKIGIARAVRAGSMITVSGTAPIGNNGKTVGIEDPEIQAKRCLQIIQEALAGLGATLSDVVRTRIYLTRIQDWEKISRVHGELFSAIRPACTVVQVVRFIDPDWLVEIEADAVIAG